MPIGSRGRSHSNSSHCPTAPEPGAETTTLRGPRPQPPRADAPDGSHPGPLRQPQMRTPPRWLHPGEPEQDGAWPRVTSSPGQGRRHARTRPRPTSPRRCRPRDPWTRPGGGGSPSGSRQRGQRSIRSLVRSTHLHRGDRGVIRAPQPPSSRPAPEPGQLGRRAVRRRTPPRLGTRGRAVGPRARSACYHRRWPNRKSAPVEGLGTRREPGARGSGEGDPATA